MKPIEERNKKEKLQYIENIIESEDISSNVYSHDLLILLQDKDKDIKLNAINAVWEIPGLKILKVLKKLSEKDPDNEIRIQAIISLGRYMYELDNLITDDQIFSEYEEDDLPKENLVATKDFLIRLYNNPERSVHEKRYALEALGFLGIDKIDDLITEAYNSNDALIKLSAINAMGKSGNTKWTDIILKELHSENKENQYEAIRAAGELYLEEAGRDLLQLTYATDINIIKEAVWALGKTGYSEAFERLDELTMSAEDELQEIAEAALDEWYISSGSYNIDFDDDWDDE